MPRTDQKLDDFPNPRAKLAKDPMAPLPGLIGCLAVKNVRSAIQNRDEVNAIGTVSAISLESDLGCTLGSTLKKTTTKNKKKT